MKEKRLFFYYVLFHLLGMVKVVMSSFIDPNTWLTQSKPKLSIKTQKNNNIVSTLIKFKN